MAKKAYACWVPGYNDRLTSETFEAFDAEEAAEKCCERYHDNSAEYPASTKVCVLEGFTVKTFEVTWEAIRDYTAMNLDDLEE